MHFVKDKIYSLNHRLTPKKGVMAYTLDPIFTDFSSLLIIGTEDEILNPLNIKARQLKFPLFN